ncbi:ATP-grasp domain-containing protein [Labilibacter marinus]|uniref:ATP-grasp domain-containing protein n=1 Tax=Labilibacter marinus TaxID=1477105 RepID=UPI00082E0F24|nr:ATP-grasp domain-containing protein [Labilibacter marinus]
MLKKQKKILIIPALDDHVDLINLAKQKGYIVITCDNNPENIGHFYGNVSKNISLLDVNKLISTAKKNRINAVCAFSTDIGAVAANKIARELNMHYNPFEAVEIMASKKLFREFLCANNFLSPKFQVIEKYDQLNLDDLNLPLIIKPTDRAGSKGVQIINEIEGLREKIDFALSYSFKKEVIIEEYIETDFKQVHGDAIVQNGRLLFQCLGDQYFGEGALRFSPIATTFPTTIPIVLKEKLIDELKRFVETIGYKNGGINVEARINKNGEIVFIELGPRFGGNFIPKAIEFACGVNVSKCAFQLAIKTPITISSYNINDCIFQLILRSTVSGKFRSVNIDDKKQFRILQDYSIKNKGDEVTVGDGTGNIISVYIIEAVSKDVSIEIIRNIKNYFNVIID